MSQIRGTIFFAARNSGWSETYFHNAATFTSQLIADFEELVSRRLALSSDDVSIVHCRLSDDLVRRDAVPVSVPAFAAHNSGYEGNTDFTFVSALTRITASNILSRNLYLRGIPDGLTHTAIGKITDPSWVQAFNRLKSWLTTGRFCLKAIDRNLNANRPIESFTLTTGDQVVLQVTAHGLVTGQQIVVGNVRNMPSMNKVWRVTVVNANSFTLIGYPLANRNELVAGDGYFYKQIYALYPFTDMAQIRIVSHRSGRVFGQPVGRRKRRK